MFMTLTLLKRRSDLTIAAFVERYETGHARLGERLLRGHATRYVRRYLHPVPDAESGAVMDDAHDVAMEIWYPDRATWEAVMARLAAPETMAEIAADEETLFNRARTRFFVVEERERLL